MIFGGLHRFPAYFTRYGSGVMAIIVGLAVYSSGAFAAETEWKGNDKSKLRLIAAKAEWLGKTEIFAGIEISLAPKWKTYWRTPGDTGIPPFFDWAGSENIEKIEVLYPVPHRFKDGTGMSIGYKSGVTLPVRIIPKDPSRPVKLKLDANYAICYDLCVPVAAEHSMVIEGGDLDRNAPLIDMALSELPVPLSKNGSDDIGVQKVTVSKNDDGKLGSLNFKVMVPTGARSFDLFVEAEGGVYVPTPKRVRSGGDNSSLEEFVVDLSAIDDADALSKLMLTCTLKVDQRAIVQSCSAE